MTYKALIIDIQAEHQNNYFELILTHSRLILEEIGRTSKRKVAEDLNQTATQFSIAYKYIQAHHNLVNNKG